MVRIEELLNKVAQLRSSDGCAWDRKQTHESLIPYLIEESAEVQDAILSGNKEALKEELGDLLYQIVLQSQIASETGDFNFLEVAEMLTEKIVRRHPHVFSGVIYQNEQEQRLAWEQIKREERHARGEVEENSLLSKISQQLPTLKRAEIMQKRAASVGFDWSTYHDVLIKVDEELQELLTEIELGDQVAQEEEFGDLLFALINLARHLNIDPERALMRCNRKFEERFRYVERAVDSDFTGRTLEELDQYWNEAKKGKEV